MIIQDVQQLMTSFECGLLPIPTVMVHFCRGNVAMGIETDNALSLVPHPHFRGSARIMSFGIPQYGDELLIYADHRPFFIPEFSGAPLTWPYKEILYCWPKRVQPANRLSFATFVGLNPNFPEMRPRSSRRKLI